MSGRYEGHTQTRVDHREAQRVGRNRSEEDFSPQAVTNELRTVAVYQLGPPQRPPITFDNGHLVLGRRSATAGDYVALAKWKAKLEVAEALRPDLTDALAAYRYFLEGGGVPRTFSYERYVMNDNSGRVTLANAIASIQWGAIELYKKYGNANFSLTGSQIGCGSGHLFPYPETENWQKAIGGHMIWLSGNVTVTNASSSSGPHFSLEMTLHAEDRYNFNPGQADIATGIPDSDNGRFEVTGLGNQFDNTATLTRHVEWDGLLGSSAGAVSSNNTDRQRQSGDNRRARNRI